MFIGMDVEEASSLSYSRDSSSTRESRLPERSGTSAFNRPSEFREEMEMAGTVASASAVGAQQKVSLFHNLQLRFSNRRPSSSWAAQRENTRLQVRQMPLG